MSVVFRHALNLLGPSAPLEFAWNDWRYTDYFFYETAETVAPFQTLSDLGNRALTIATAEFVAARFADWSDSREALQFFDCAWSTLLQEGTCDYAVLPRDEWSGPVRNPLRAAMLVVNETMFEARQDGDFPARTVWMLQLARHVMPKAALQVFEGWFEASKARLDVGWSNIRHRGGLFSDDFDRGPMPGPVVFASFGSMSVQQAEASLRDHVQALDPQNPWLADPERQPDPHGHSH